LWHIIIIHHENVWDIKLLLRFLQNTWCTSNVNSHSRLRGNDKIGAADRRPT
jgi:hypothetical protein